MLPTDYLGQRLRAAIETHQDFPSPGVTFADLNRVYATPRLFGEVVQDIATKILTISPLVVRNNTKILAVESRGFILGAALARELYLPLVLARKQGSKLPGERHEVTYDTEYSKDGLWLQKGRIHEGNTVILVDDVLASGGTLRALASLTMLSMAVPLKAAVIFEIASLKGRDTLPFPLLRSADI